MPKETSKELTAIEEANRRLAAIAIDIQQNYLVGDANPAEAIAMMAVPILEAETFEDLFLGSGVDDLHETLLDVGLHVTAVTFNRSDYEEGLPFYVTFHGKKLADGSDFVANCGAWQVVLVAYKCIKNNWLPRNFTFHRQEKATRRGYHPVNIYPWDEF